MDVSRRTVIAGTAAGAVAAGVLSTLGQAAPAAAASDGYLVGCGRADMTGAIAGQGMMGYSDTEQVAEGLRQRCWARAYVIVDAATGERVVFVNADIACIFQSHHMGLMPRLRKRFGGLYTERNVNLNATHNHNSCGGTAWDFAYSLAAFGFKKNSYEAEMHLAEFGRASEPSCFTLQGYAHGHASLAHGTRILCVETACRAQGHPYCRFRVGFREDMEKHFPGCADDYRRLDLGRLFRELEQTVEAQSRTIRELREQLGAAPAAGAAASAAFSTLTGRSPALARAIDIARAVAGVSSTVLVTGESGTGKELLARGIHAASARAAGPWIALNCATLTESLQIAELFGHAKGAYTGAAGERAGLFEAASGGTLFLDEVGELSPSAQAALLRVLQEGVIVRVGEHRERPVDVRIVAATHRDLEARVGAGQFRADLFYRLNVVSIRMPALRERDNDVLLLAQSLLERYGARFGRNVQALSPEVLRLFLAHPWPGNVRELANVLERAVLLARGTRIELEDLPDGFAAAVHGDGAAAALPGAPEALGQQEREHIRSALERSHGRRDVAATLLGISRATLWRRMKRLGLA